VKKLEEDDSQVEVCFGCVGAAARLPRMMLYNPSTSSTQSLFTLSLQQLHPPMMILMTVHRMLVGEDFHIKIHSRLSVIYQTICGCQTVRIVKSGTNRIYQDKKLIEVPVQVKDVGAVF
jgi:hypothetical protein